MRFCLRWSVVACAMLVVAQVGTVQAATADRAPRAIVIKPAAAAANQFTFVIDSSWTPSEQATLSSWLAPGSLELQALNAVVGPPSASATVTITKDPTSPFAGEYLNSTHTCVLADLELGVLVHELNHASHGNWILGPGDVWEEGMARAAEIDEANMLLAEGVTAAGDDFDIHHSYYYDEYYENANVTNIGPAGSQIFGAADPALVLARYEQAGYAFGKLLIENPAFMTKFNALVYGQPSGTLTVAKFKSMAASVQPKVEGVKFAAWYTKQHIFDSAPPAGCQIYQRINQFTVDVFCRANGAETVQPGVNVTLSVFGASGALVSREQATTGSLGSATFSPSLGSYSGRLKVVASATVGGSPIASTGYRQSGPESGVFGVVTNVSSGKITFSSPTKAFATFTVSVANGAFAAAKLQGFAGKVVAKFSGAGRTASQTFDKDSSPFSLVLTAA